MISGKRSIKLLFLFSIMFQEDDILGILEVKASKINMNPFVPNTLFLYALKTSENHKVF